MPASQSYFRNTQIIFLQISEMTVLYIPVWHPVNVIVPVVPAPYPNQSINTHVIEWRRTQNYHSESELHFYNKGRAAAAAELQLVVSITILHQSMCFVTLWCCPLNPKSFKSASEEQRVYCYWILPTVFYYYKASKMKNKQKQKVNSS